MTAGLKIVTAVVLLAAPSVWALDASEFQTTKQDAKFAEKMQELDLNGDGIDLAYKTGGTSVGLKITKDGKNHGKWMPSCSGANPEAQVVSYQLGRFLGMSDLVMPSAYYRLTGNALAKFKNFLTSANERNKWRAYNRDLNLRAISQSPDGLIGVYTPKLKIKKFEAVGLEAPATDTINRADPIARFIRANGPMPQANKPMILKGEKPIDGEALATASELELSREFSMIMVLDILTGQWDRWSGGNVEAAQVDGKLIFLARDNGGANMSGKGTFSKYSIIVSRFDRRQIARVERLAQLLQDPQEAPQLISALQLTSDPKFLLDRAQSILTFVQQQVATYGERAVFFPDAN